MDKAHKPSDSEFYTPSSEPFTFDYIQAIYLCWDKSECKNVFQTVLTFMT
jgi:hypothetical protein